MRGVYHRDIGEDWGKRTRLGFQQKNKQKKKGELSGRGGLGNLKKCPKPTAWKKS